MANSNLSNLLSVLCIQLHTCHAHAQEEWHLDPVNSEQIVELCQKVVCAIPSGLDASQQTAQDVFSLLCNPDLFSRLELWDHDDKIMRAALALYSVLPSTAFEAYHVTHLANFFSQACTLGTARNRLICSLLQGPKDHWKAEEIESMYYIFMELEGEMSVTEEYQNQPISSVAAFLHGLQEMSVSKASHCKAAKDTLYKSAFSLLCDDRLKLYPDIFSTLQGYTLVKKCIELRHLHGGVMENLDRMISDQQLDQWFPKVGKQVNILAQAYPRLQARLEKRTLLQQLSNIHTTQRRQKI